MLDLDGYKIISYGQNGIKSMKRAEEFASWYLTSNIDLLFGAKKNNETSKNKS